MYNYLVESNASQETFLKFKDKFLALTKFVDSDPSYPLTFDKFRIQLENGDVIFLGSDGVYNFINMFY
ncbi:MAG: serine/threonine-protein phosphatase, partial [Mycoplasmoidaceae bacterium]|nr:serine/threonine-protein phosphatase [Mycoplasmoidaceae bacterium]